MRALPLRPSFPPRELLARCQAIERRMGRVPTEKWGPRIIDLDLLIYRDTVMREPDLVLPHPHIGERAFVLAPLMDIAPDVKIGGTQRPRPLRRDRSRQACARSLSAKAKRRGAIRSTALEYSRLKVAAVTSGCRRR